MSGPHQQQWPPSPAWNPPPRRRRSRWLTVGLPVGIVVLVAVGLLGYLVVRAFTEGIRPARDATRAYADALVDQRWDDAHAMLCEASAEEFSAQDLATSFGDPPLTGAGIEGVNVVWSNGRTTGDATIVFETDGGVRERTVMALVEEDDIWRPCP